jgi:hypothetical protein
MANTRTSAARRRGDPLGKALACSRFLEKALRHPAVTDEGTLRFKTRVPAELKGDPISVPTRRCMAISTSMTLSDVVEALQAVARWIEQGGARRK